MKHPASVVVMLLSLFFAAQIVGLFVLDSYVDAAATEETGVVTYRELPAGLERPEVDPQYSFVLISLAVIVGTVLLLLIMRFRVFNLWKLWYFLAVALSLAIAWAAFIPQAVAGALAVAASALKVMRPNFIVHNLTELFIYAGLAAIFVPVLNIFSASILLILISIYDMYAVWRSKHMVALAKFQSSSNMFAGLSIPKKMPLRKALTAAASAKKVSDSSKLEKDSVAIIGGGDIGFPLLFAGAVMAQYGLQKTFIIPAFALLGLAFLFLISKKGRFYPAMPFVSAGCFLGYAVLSLAF